jgi:hypothetical protein
MVLEGGLLSPTHAVPVQTKSLIFLKHARFGLGDKGTVPLSPVEFMQIKASFARIWGLFRREVKQALINALANQQIKAL